jgi:hypothetical protein
MCERKAIIWRPQTFIDSEHMHTILLENLQPSTTYYYRVGSNEHMVGHKFIHFVIVHQVNMNQYNQLVTVIWGYHLLNQEQNQQLIE